MMAHLTETEIIYPDSNGKPIADNTLQWEWMVAIKSNLEALFKDRPDVFVAGDLLWYPVEGSPKIRVAPDAMVAFGRPKGYRGSYKQWQEAGIAPQVAFEILSPGNTKQEMREKRFFYETHGVEEYYQYDPDDNDLKLWIRSTDKRTGNPTDELVRVETVQGFISPRLGVRFELTDDTLHLFHPDGRPFETYLELIERLDLETHRADAERERADAERERADTETQRADVQSQRADAERERAEKLAAKLRDLGVSPDTP